MDTIRIIHILIGTIILGCLLTPTGYGEPQVNNSVLSQPIPFSASIAADADTWQQKLSSDLLQLLDPATTPPGRTPDDIANEMEILGRLRYDQNDSPEIPVTITRVADSDGERIISYLNQTVTDPAYNIISGWVHLSDLTDLAALPEVRQITSLLPPVSSGSLISNKDLLQKDPSSSNITPPHSSDINLINGDFVQHNISSGFINPQEASPRRTTRIWKEKLSTDLLQLLDDQYLSPGQSSVEAHMLMTATGELRLIAGNISEVRVSARSDAASPVSYFQQYFSGYEADSQYGQISGWIAVANLSRLASEPGVVSVMAQIPPLASQVTTEGDSLLHTDDFRNDTGLSGKGVKIGIISDGVNSLNNVIAEGQLPSDVHVLRNNIGGDEGTAMLQIVHDIAPGSELFFHDRGSSQIEFVQGMDALISSGCRIICDDITYVEPFFEDGYIARNIRDRILSYGILYVTSAGNFAREHYQAPFNGYMDKGYQWHNFSGSYGSPDLKFTTPPDSAGHIILQWDDRFGESANNYDLFVYNSEHREIGRSVKIQDGDDDPMEYCRFINKDPVDKDFYLRVVQAGGENRTIEIYVLPMGGSAVTMDPCVPDDSMFGQQVVSEALAVGAVSSDAEQAQTRPFSSRGPITIKYPVPELRQKPDLSAPDGVTVSTGDGSFGIFSGTSASAPHVAGLACLLWSSDPDLREGDIRACLINSTRGGSTSWDPAQGFGIPDARLLISRIQTSPNQTIEAIHQINYSRTFQPREIESDTSLLLYQGWNMISIPFPLENRNNTGMIFSAINTSSHTIWRYVTKDKGWEPVRPDSTLTQMDVIWIFSDDRRSLPLDYDDSRQNMTARHLNQGWNPLGIPGRNSVTAGDLLKPLKNTWSYILVYDSRIQQYRPAIVNGGSGQYSDSRLLYPTEGFWVYMNGPGIVIP